ncbi:unnamed protein product, partial [Owenia fusiformis]
FRSTVLIIVSEVDKHKHRTLLNINMSSNTSSDEPVANYTTPVVELPTVRQLREISEELGFNLTEDQLEQHRDYLKGFCEAYQKLEELVEPTLEVKFPRTSGHKPTKEENPYNAW